MCGKETVISDEHNHKNENKQQQGSSTMLIEQIDGTSYTFDTANCALMFKKFNAVYGSDFADE